MNTQIIDDNNKPVYELSVYTDTGVIVADTTTLFNISRAGGLVGVLAHQLNKLESPCDSDMYTFIEISWVDVNRIRGITQRPLTDQLYRRRGIVTHAQPWGAY